MSQSLSTAEVARVLQLRESRVRELVRSGLCGARRSGRGYVFSFQDLVVLRAARDLVEQGVPLARVRRALAALSGALPEGRPASGLRVWADGRQVAVRQGGTAWQPETGQTLLDFEVDELAERVAELRREPEPPTTRSLLEAQGWFERALELEESDRRAASEAYERALELDPDLVDAWVNLGRMAHESGDAKEAARLYHLALERSPEDPVVHFNLALALEDAHGAGEALAHYRRAIALDPDFADAHYNLAGLCEQLGQRADAIRHYHAYQKLTGA